MGGLRRRGGLRAAGHPAGELGLGLPAAPWTSSSGRERGRFVGLSEHAEVSVVVVTYNSARDVSDLMVGLRATARDRSIRLIVVDNDSSDDTVELLRSETDVTLVESGGNLGYAGGINVGLASTENSDYVLFLNPDLAVAPDTVARMLAVAKGDRVGGVVPLILDDDGTIHPTLFREPSLIRCLCDAVLTRGVCSRLGLPSESDIRRRSYVEPHDVDWAMGAALLVPAAVAREVGPWNETFFLYAEEVDYSRRIRALDLAIRFEPLAMVKHRGGGSGSSPDLEALKAANRVRYIELYHGKPYSTAYRVVVMLRHLLRAHRSVDRRALVTVASRRRWLALRTELQTAKGPAQDSAA